MKQKGWRDGAARADAWAIALITIISALPYVGRLGFYSDDWGLLARFAAADREGRLAAQLASDFIDRPVQGFYLGLLFKAFGPDALGYHLVNTAVVAGSVALFYVLLVRLTLGRAESFGAALLFAMLPQLSTVRIWYSAFQIPLSLALALGSMHFQLSFARTRRRPWLVAAVAAALLSIGAYEIFAPLILGFGAGIAWRRRRGVGFLAAAIGGAVLLGIVYKLVLSGRSQGVAEPKRYVAGLKQLVRLDYDWRTDSGLNVIATPATHFWAPAEGLWRGLWSNPGFGVITAALIIGAIAWWRLSRSTELQSAASMLLLGLAAFLLGNAIFLIVPAVVFSPTGMGNRVHVAAALGVAMIFAGALAGLTRRQPRLFAIIVTVIAPLAFVRLSAIERFWGEAPAMQEQVLAAARRDLRQVPAGSKIILDGVCPYHGPAVVFETTWDIGPALTLALGRPVTGDAVSERMHATPTGLTTEIYKEPNFYAYGPNLFVYDPRNHLLVRLSDAQAAARYFNGRGPGRCPTGYVARGVEV